MTGNRVAVYTRVNAVDEDAMLVSTALQEQWCRDWAEKHGLEVVDVVSDSNLDRGSGSLPLLVSKVKSGDCDGVVVSSLDRLGRSLMQSQYAIGDLIEAGFLASAREDIDSREAMGTYFMRVTLAVAETWAGR